MKIIKWIFIIIGLFFLNFFLLSYLLRVGDLYQNISESRIDKELKGADFIYDFSPNMKDRLLALDLGDKFNLGYLGTRIPYSAAEEHNPYPPILHPFDSAYVVYKKDYEFKQITILSGECDSTPSILVEKARGKETGFGDYFVTYIFYQERVLNRYSDYDYNAVDWYSWRGGSYNGFEELWVFPLSLIQILILVSMKIIKKRKKRKSLLNT